MSSLADLWPAWPEARVIHDDDALLAVDKPAGLSCHPSEHPDVANVRARLTAWLGDQRLWLPQPIDADLSGVLVFAKTKAANRVLAAELTAGVHKTHVAVVTQKRFPHGYEGRVMSRGAGRWLVALSSARPAQPLRRILRDSLVDADAHRPMLHVAELSLHHPVTGEPLTLRAPVPKALYRQLDPIQALSDDAAGIAERLHIAADRRWGVAMSTTDAFRIANSGGDELPGVEVDRYGDFAVVSLRSDEAIERREAVLDAVSTLGFAGVYLKIRRPHASVLVDTRKGDVAPAEPVRGAAAPEPLTVHENGVPLLAALGDGLSTGVFLDQRDGRRWVRERHAASVCNLFAYHGAFTVAAIAGGAVRSITVDAARPALDAALRNLALVDADPVHHELVKADAFSWLKGAAKRDRRFDLVVLDPPSYSTTRRTTFRADRDYRGLAALALRTVAPGGALLACTNHRGIVRAKLQKELERAADEAGVRVERMTPLPDPVDFPPEPGQPCHLKRIAVEVQ